MHNDLYINAESRPCQFDKITFSEPPVSYCFLESQFKELNCISDKNREKRDLEIKNAKIYGYIIGILVVVLAFLSASLPYFTSCFHTEDDNGLILFLILFFLPICYYHLYDFSSFFIHRIPDYDFYDNESKTKYCCLKNYINALKDYIIKERINLEKIEKANHRRFTIVDRLEKSVIGIDPFEHLKRTEDYECAVTRKERIQGLIFISIVVLCSLLTVFFHSMAFWGLSLVPMVLSLDISWPKGGMFPANRLRYHPPTKVGKAEFCQYQIKQEYDFFCKHYPVYEEEIMRIISECKCEI